MLKNFFEKKKSVTELEDEALEEVRMYLLDKYHEDDFIQYLFSMKTHRDIMHNIKDITFTFNAYLMRFRLNDMSTNKINNEKYNIILEWKDYDNIFAYKYVKREERNWLDRYGLDKESYKDKAREVAVELYEKHKESKTHPYYKKPCTNIDEIIRYNSDFEFYRIPIASKVECLKDVKIPIVMKQQ